MATKRVRRRDKPRDKALIDIIAHFGNASALARFLGVSNAAVGLWWRVPQEHVFKLEKETGLTPHQMRPDIYRPEPAAPARKGKPPRRPHGQA